MHTRSLPAKAGNDGYAGTIQPTKKGKKSKRILNSSADKKGK